MKENWKPVVGYEELYEVSDQGRVRSLDREVRVEYQHGPVVKKLKGREIKPSANKSGHLQVCLCREGQRVMRQVHRLVLEAFRGSCPPGHECCHWDDDPTNNRLDNLRWGTKSENELDKVRNGNNHHARKTHCPQGHEYTPENTYALPSRPTARYCRECHRAKQRRYRARKKKREAYQHLTERKAA